MYAGSYYGGNQYPLMNQQPMSNFQMLQQQQQGPTQQQPQVQQGLNGKIVDGEDVVRATEVPIGGYGIFPKADLSEIYMKQWNSNGTTSVITFRPVIADPVSMQKDSGELTNILIQKIDTLENKLDMFLNQPAVQPQPVERKKLEVSNNGF